MDGHLQAVASIIGLSTQMLLIATTLLSGYAFSLLYRLVVRKYSPTTQYLYFSGTGIALFLFNYGLDIYHSFICIIVTYALVRFLTGTLLSVIIGFIFLMVYLLVGYSYTAQGDYDLSWSLPQCVLTLRLIGLLWDVYDGRHHSKSTLSDNQNEAALGELPSFLELVAFVYFYSGFLVGPQFPLTRLRSLVRGEFDDPSSGLPRKNTWQCLHRLVLSFIYGAFYIAFSHRFPTEFFLGADFKSESLLWKCWHACIWLRVTLSRYVSCWLAVEGSCILAGLAYNGEDPKTNVARWDGLRNIRTTKFELGCTFRSVIESFNTNTNQWAFRYVFKRLKFLGNKAVSHFLTLMFLALWHGYHSGYFVCFLFEYICVVAERQATSVVQHFPKVDNLLNRGIGFYCTWIVKKLLVMFGCAYGLLSFSLLKFESWWQVYKDFYFCGWLVYGIVWQTCFAMFSFLTRYDTGTAHKHKD